MFRSLIEKFFGSPSSRLIKKLKGTVQQINELESNYASFSDEQLRENTTLFKKRLSEGEPLDKLLPEAFATMREACKRTLGLRPFDVQLLGGIIMHKGMIVEMKTGEGKTLVATLPAYLNALSGKGVHIVTVNDYLAQRDSAWMGQIFRFLGLSVGCITSNMSPSERKENYDADITYATNNELGFDYLRDNMQFNADQLVQRAFHYAIVDEIDSILIDEARTPLIISGPAEDSSYLYQAVDGVVRQITSEHYEKDEKQNNVTLTESGVEYIEKILRDKGLLTTDSLYDAHNITLVHHVNQSLKAHALFHKEKEYIIRDNKIVIIDEFTGRMMEGRRYSDGLHQALEAKENVPVQVENQTLASVTFQNYFKLYPKLSGMTGTCMTEALEFAETYNLEIVDLPTNVPCARKDLDDEVYRTEKEKFDAVIALIKDCLAKKQPVLVGTASIEKSEQLSISLKKHAIPHNVLNARYHEQEAQIIAEAGRPGAVTLSTNMAGRGTDIKLGGNFDVRLKAELADMPAGPEREAKIKQIADEIKADAEVVKKAGGLYVIGTERHESRRIDNQLRGRSGRQGDPGASKFFLSLEDDLMRIFGSDRLDSLLKKLGLKEGEAITHPWINRALEKAQSKVEARNYDARKHVLKYDNVMNDQRKVIYDLRRELMAANDVHAILQGMLEDVLAKVSQLYFKTEDHISSWDFQGLHEECLRLFSLKIPVQQWEQEANLSSENVRDYLRVQVQKKWAEKYSSIPEEIAKLFQKNTLLRLLDQHWKDHLLSLDYVRQGINLRSYAQKNPLNEYKQEAFELFEDMLERLKDSVLSTLSLFEVPEMPEEILPDSSQEKEVTYSSYADSAASEIKPLQDFNPSDSNTWEGNVSRNMLCPCGSKKKYKYCHGELKQKI